MSERHENLTPFPHAPLNRCFGCGPLNSAGLHLEFLVATDRSVVSLPAVGENYTGLPGYLHGGIIATLLDEAMSKSLRVLGKRAMTRNMEVDYLRPVPSGVPIRIEGRVVRSEQRKVWAEGRILNAHGTVLAHGKGLFIEVRPKQKIAGQPEDHPDERSGAD
jgi:uncharacterized protein (TIGR00369 family)